MHPIFCKIMKFIQVLIFYKSILFIRVEKVKKHYIVRKGVLANTSQRVKIYKRSFNEGKENFKNILHRLKALFKGFKEGYILADNIFFDKKTSPPNYDFYIIEPDFSIDGQDDKYFRLKEYLENKLDSFTKKKIFENILLILKKIHEQNISHLNINFKNIWLEEGNIIYLRPFTIDLEEINEKINESCLKNKYSSFYRSPEETFISDYVQKTRKNDYLLKCDLWAIGCIFSELFLELKEPLFATKDAEEKLFKYFEILYFPDKKNIPFLDENYYEEIKRIMKKKSTKQQILKTNYLKKSSFLENKILINLFVFDPKKRLNCAEILSFDFFENESPISPMKPISKKLFSSAKSKTKYIDSMNSKNSLDMSFNSFEENPENLSNSHLSFMQAQPTFQNDSNFNNNDNDLEWEGHSFSSSKSKSDQQEWSNIEPLITPKYEKIHFKSQKNLKESKKKMPIPYSKSVFVNLPENSYDLSTTNFTNTTKIYSKEIWITIKCLKIFIFKSLRNCQISLEMIKERNGRAIQQDSAPYVKILNQTFIKKKKKKK